MPDYNPHPTSQAGMRRPLRYQDGETSDRPGDLRADLEPAPKPWPGLPYLAVLLVFGFLALQLYPATHWRHPNDKTRTWIKHLKPGEKPEIIQATGRDAFYSTLDEVRGQQAEDLAAQEGVVQGEDHDEETIAFLKKAGEQPVHIFICTNDTDFRPIAVLVNSTLSNALHPERLHFHLVLPSSLHRKASHLSAIFQNAKIDIASESIDMNELDQHIYYRNNSKARQELKSPYNFVPFLLPRYFKDVGRIIYLDTDIVVKGNIEELMQINLEGKPAAAVEDCSQKLGTYFDFHQLEKIQAREDNPAWVPKDPISREACVFNRGVLLIDTKEWIKQQVTESIFWWMDEFRNASAVLYRYGLSQPPFLLSLYDNYKKLDLYWNVRGLGRNEFSEQEREYMLEKHKYKPPRRPFISLDADAAKILHFNGKFKPWKSAEAGKVSLCGEKGVECAKLWWEYLGHASDIILRE